MPRVKTDAERGWIGAWLRKQRGQRGWSPEQVLAHLGQPIRVDYYRGLEAGRRPGPELLAAFEEMYGPLPPEPVTPTPDDRQGDLVAVLSEIRDELRLSRLVSERSAEVLAELLGTLAVGRPLLEGTPDASDVRVETGAR